MTNRQTNISETNNAYTISLQFLPSSTSIESSFVVEKDTTAGTATRNDIVTNYLLRSAGSVIELLKCSSPLKKGGGKYSFELVAGHIFDGRCIEGSTWVGDKVAIIFRQEIVVTDSKFNIICQHQLQHFQDHQPDDVF